MQHLSQKGPDVTKCFFHSLGKNKTHDSPTFARNMSQQECSNMQPPALEMSMQQQLAVALLCNAQDREWQHEMLHPGKTEVSA